MRQGAGGGEGGGRKRAGREMAMRLPQAWWVEREGARSGRPLGHRIARGPSPGRGRPSSLYAGVGGGGSLLLATGHVEV